MVSGRQISKKVDFLMIFVTLFLTFLSMFLDIFLCFSNLDKNRFSKGSRLLENVPLGRGNDFPKSSARNPWKQSPEILKFAWAGRPFKPMLRATRSK